MLLGKRHNVENGWTVNGIIFHCAFSLVMVASVISKALAKSHEPILLESQAEPNFERKPPQALFIRVEPEIKGQKELSLHDDSRRLVGVDG